MMAAVVEHGWDGDWFLRAYDFFGDPVGSASNDGGPDLHRAAGHVRDGGRSASTTGRAAAGPRLGRASDSATPHGIVLLQPAVHAATSRARRDLAPTRRDTRRTAAVFCHTNPWIMIAETMVGNARPRVRLLPADQPVRPRGPIARSIACEPYVYAQMIAGQGRRDARRGEELVAHRHGGVELRGHHPVDPRHPARARRPADRPCLPSAWDGFRAVRRFRGATYRIAIDKPGGVTGRVTSLRVDGRQVDGNVVAPAPEGSDVTVEGTIT